MKTSTPAALAARFSVLLMAAMLVPTLAGAQVLSVNPTAVSTQASVGTNAPSQSVQISNAGNGALKWTATESSSWLSVSPSSGINNDSLTLAFQTSFLAAGQYQTTVRLDSNGGSRDIPVTVTIGSGSGGSTPPPSSTADISVSSTTLSPGSSVTVSFSGIANPTSTDWISLAPAGSSLNTYLDWKYAGSCTRSPGAAKASGSCQFNAPSTGGNYEFRLFANDVFTRLDSVAFSVSGSSTSSPPPPPTVDISVSSTTPSPGSSVTVSFSILNPTSTDWISVAPAGSSLSTYLDWKYAGSCTQTPGAAKSSGSCQFNAPSTGGNYEFRLFANDLFTLLDSVAFTVSGSSSSPPPPPPPPSSGYGPQSSITCPSGAVDIWPGVSIQTMVDSNPGNTTFCIRAGTHSLRNSIIPKTGDTFVGEYGAVLDGTGWSTSDDTQAAFRGHLADIDYVTVRNLVIRNMPQRGIHAYYYQSNNWTVEYNEIGPNRNVGIVFPSSSVIRNNYIHHNAFSGYMGPYAHNSTLEGNEIAYNGTEQKISESNNVTFRNNFVHHNSGGGIWYDSNNTGVLVEGNRVEDNGYSGIWLEISSGGTVRNNTVRRSGDAGVFISTSKNMQVYGNTLDSNFRGITFFVNCPSVGGGIISFDLANNSASNNSITVGTRSGALATAFSYGSCTTTQAAAYVNGSKNLTFSGNSYRVPSTSGQFWYWNSMMYWTTWQSLGHDLSGSVSQ